MTTQGNVIYVHSDAIDAASLKSRHIAESAEEVTIHELLHVCGDVRNDGVVRHNWAGTTAIRRLLWGE